MGYIEPMEASIETYRAPKVTLRLVNIAEVFKRKVWSDLDRVPLGGQSVNAAMDEVLASEGFDSSYRSWSAAGDAWLLPLGAAEAPFEFPPAGEAKFATLSRLASYAGLEVGVSDQGLFYTQPIGFVSSQGHAFSGAPLVHGDDQLRRMIETARLRYDSAENKTAVMVKGTLEDGSTAMALAVDLAAEANPLSPRFSGMGRDLEIEDLGDADLDTLEARAAALAAELFRPAWEPSLYLPVNRDVSRRERALIRDAESIGIAPTDWHVVLELEHYLDKFVGKSRTTAGLVRL
jgi:hypothetical protein